MLYVPSGYFVLDVEKGPYDALPIIYGVVLAGWLLMAIYWNVWTFLVYRNKCLLLCRAISGIPVVKCVVLIFGVSFWSTCVSWDMCSFWMGVSLINAHLVYETGEMVIFILIAKGWSITRDNFSANEWRGVIMSMAGFYMANSIVLVLESSVLTAQGFWAASAVLYGFMYLYILSGVIEQIQMLRFHVSNLRREMPENIAGPLRKKLCMYICFSLIVLSSIAIEILTHSLVVNDGRLWIVLLIYEVSNMIILFTIGWIFRPREHSPYFFMVPARAIDDNTVSRPTPVIEVGKVSEDGDDEGDFLTENRSNGRNAKDSFAIELAPLLSEMSGEMIIIRNPDSTVSLGQSLPDLTDTDRSHTRTFNSLQIERALL